MCKVVPMSFVVVAAVLSLRCAAAAPDAAEFENPSRAHRPETWFHLIGGNVSKEGLDADLDALKEAGISGIQLFHGQLGKAFAWPGTTSQIPCLGKDWDGMIRHVAEGCRERGLTFKMQNCPGWSQCGGPWIAASNAMRMAVCRRTDIEGGGHVNVKLPAQWLMVNDPNRDYCDVCVLAFPTPEGDVPEVFERKPDEKSDTNGVLRLVYRFPEPMLFRSMEIPNPQALNHAWAYLPGASVSVNGSKPVEIPQGSWQDVVRLTVAIAGNEPRREWVVEFRHKRNIRVDKVCFRTAPRLFDWEAKAGMALRGGMAAGPSDALAGVPSVCFVKGGEVRDITSNFKDGRLNWDAPAGRWTVLRIGHVNMCTRNGPAPKEATGWECDKLTPSGVEANFAAYIGRLAKGSLAGGLLDGFVVDSWECLCPTWSRTLERDFCEMRGYALRPMLPAIFGWIVDSPERTEDFLKDWRRTLGELVERNYHGRMAELARENGLSVEFETSFGDVLPGDIMAYWKHCDTPMCEFWTPRSAASCGQPDFKPIAPCASAAHVYGKRRVAAEACTNTGLDWKESLKGLKDAINNAYARGVTHLVFHTYTHNPQVGFFPPGTSFGAGVGTPFLRGQTWWRHMPDFTAWAARCETMLEAGSPVNDVLWHLGEAVDHKPGETSPFPHGYKADYVNRDALLSRIAVKDGRFVTPEGVAWKVLWVPETKWMSPEVKEKLDGFAKAGGKVSHGTPEEAVAGIAPDVVVGPDVKGRMFDGWRKEFREEQVQWIHRRSETSDWYFVAANGDDGYDGEVTFRATGVAELWDPVTGGRRAAEVMRTTDATTTVRLSLAAAECVFVVFDGAPQRRGEAVAHGAKTKEERDVTVPVALSRWTLSFPAGWGAPETLALDGLASWTALPIGREGRHFSGTATYLATFDAKAGERLSLDLGKVESAATVYVNGVKVRSMWCAPFRCEIDGSLVKDGRNGLKVETTSTWRNRLVYDAGLPETERKTWTIARPNKDAPLQPSGLIGPVALSRREAAGGARGAAAWRPVPATYVMVCCHDLDKGTKFLVDGVWDSKHNYRDYPFALDQMRKIKDAGIEVVGIDFTNPSMWDQFKRWHWPMLLNVVKAARELDMQYFLFLGNTRAHTMKYWNEKAKIVWEEFARDDPHYRRYGFGDNRPMMTIFLPGRDFAAHLAASKPEEKNWLEKFRIGTCQVNDPIVPTPTDGWGYRNMSAGSTDLARFAAPNSGVAPKDWARVDADEWRRRVRWALGAKEYAVVGTYDDTCDCIFWGIADVRGSSNPRHVHESTKNNPFIYSDIVKEEIAKRRNSGK